MILILIFDGFFKNINAAGKVLTEQTTKLLHTLITILEAKLFILKINKVYIYIYIYIYIFKSIVIIITTEDTHRSGGMPHTLFKS